MRLVVDLSDLRTKLTEFDTLLPLYALGALTAQASEARGRIAGGAYFQSHTGRVAQTFKITLEDRLKVRLESRDKVAHFLNVGTKAHVIQGRRGGMLSFYWAKAGRDFLGRRVNHPGTKARAIVDKEAFQGKAGLLQKLDGAADKAIDRTGLG